jgi:hypothetical protein
VDQQRAPPVIFPNSCLAGQLPGQLSIIFLNSCILATSRATSLLGQLSFIFYLLEILTVAQYAVTGFSSLLPRSPYKNRRRRRQIFDILRAKNAILAAKYVKKNSSYREV